MREKLAHTLLSLTSSTTQMGSSTPSPLYFPELGINQRPLLNPRNPAYSQASRGLSPWSPSWGQGPLSCDGGSSRARARQTLSADGIDASHMPTAMGHSARLLMCLIR